MYPDRRMGVIRSRLSESASHLSSQRSSRQSYSLTPPGRESGSGLSGVSVPRQPSGSAVGSAGPPHMLFRNQGESSRGGGGVERPGSYAGSESPLCYRERFNIFRPHHRRRSSAGQKSKTMRKKAKVWEREFVCLACKTQYTPPGPIDRGHLIQAGLGGKTLSFVETDDAEMLHEDLLDAFPKLQAGGGYELLRTSERNTRTLDVIPQPRAGYTVDYLKGVVGQAKIYIRPLQKDLDLSPAEGIGTEFCPQEVCQGCGASIPLSQLRSHIASCAHHNQRDDSPDTPPSSPCSPAYSPITPRSQNNDEQTKGKESAVRGERVKQSLDFDDDNHDFLFPDSGIGKLIPQQGNPSTSLALEEEKDDLANTEAAMVSHAIKESVQDPVPEVIDLSEDESCVPESLDDVIKSLSRELLPEEVNMPVRRGYVLEDALRAVRRKHFPFNHTLNVQFLGEEGEDGGGPRREFFALLAKDIQSSLCEGKPTRCFLRHDSMALQTNKFANVGKLMAMSLVQGGSGFTYFAEPMFHYLCGVDPSSIKVCVDDVPNIEVTTLLRKIKSAESDKNLQDVCTNEMDLILDTGYSKPLGSLSLACRKELTSMLMMHYTIYRNKAVLDQLKSGLQVMGVGDALIKYSNLMKKFFVIGEQTPLTAEVIEKLFIKVHFSESGCNERLLEEATYMLFIDFLHDCEDGEISGLCLSQILSFFTGAEYVPPTGFPSGAELFFNSEHVFPTASTCALVLTLPTVYHNNSALFQEKVKYAMQNHGGFGIL